MKPGCRIKEQWLETTEKDKELIETMVKKVVLIIDGAGASENN